MRQAGGGGGARPIPTLRSRSGCGEPTTVHKETEGPNEGMPNSVASQTRRRQVDHNDSEPNDGNLNTTAASRRRG